MPGNRLCPKCKTPLQAVLQEEIKVDTCPSCKGIWVDCVKEKDLLKLKPEVFTVDELLRLRKAYQPFAKEDPVRYFPCPVCGELMNRVNWGTYSFVIVDKCRDHGTWYDPEEFEKIREFAILGGIEYEKYKMTEKGLGDLTAKLDREVSRLDVRINMAYLRARLWSLLGF